MSNRKDKNIRPEFRYRYNEAMQENKVECFDFSGKLSFPYAMRLKEIGEEIRRPFHDFMDGLAEGNEKRLDWWVSNLASRNIYASPFFEYCSRITLVRELAKKGELDGNKKIKVPSEGIAKVLRAFFAEHRLNIQIESVYLAEKKIRSKVKAVKDYLRYIRKTLRIRKIIRSTGKPRKPTDEPAVLVDSFLFANLFSGREYQDRYYTNMMKYLEEEQKNLIFVRFLVSGDYDAFALYSSIRDSNTNFLVKEDYLSTCDYIRSFLYPLRSVIIKFRNTKFMGMELLPLLREEIRRDVFYSASVDVC